MPDIVIRVPVEGDIEVWTDGHRFNCNPVVFKDKELLDQGRSQEDVEEAFERVVGDDWQQAY